MLGTCVRSISHSLTTKRVLEFRRINCLNISSSSASSKPRAVLIVRENAVLLPGSSSGCSGPRPRWQHQSRSIASMSSAADEQPEQATPEERKPALPPLSAHEFKQYNRLAEHMNYFHEHFRQTWTMLYNAASSGRRPAGMSIKQYIDAGLSFISHLETHHGIEESYIFPVLARKMPEFQADGKGGKKAAELLQQHKEIHKGMEVFETYLRQCKTGEKDFEMRVLKEKMDTWAEVLWKHLDQEVKTLGAENVRQYFTLEEIRKIPM